MTESKGTLGDIEMSKLDELIAELCPNGVEYKTLGEVCEYEQPGKYIVNSTDYNDDFEIPVLTAGQSFILGYTDESDGIYNASKESPVIIFDDFTAAFKWVDFPFKVKSSAMKILKTNEKALLRYVFHCMGNLNFSSTEHKRLWIATYSNFQIPVPPLPVQEEIVRILDKFTSLTAELTAELTARRKQYEYYRDALLSFGKVSPPLTFGLDGSKICWTTLEHICKNICSGGTPNTSQQEYYQGNIPWLRTQEIDWKDIYDTHVKITQSAVDSSSAKWIPANCVIVAMYGATAAKVAINKIPLTTNQACCNLEIDANLANYRYVFHWLQHKYLELKALGQGSQSNINAKIIKAFLIPLPPLSVQQRIVNVLDNFDAICSDLKIGLPAEIDARKKQYEYYRDLLLTFAERGNTILTEQNR